MFLPSPRHTFCLFLSFLWIAVSVYGTTIMRTNKSHLSIIDFVLAYFFSTYDTFSLYRFTARTQKDSRGIFVISFPAKFALAPNLSLSHSCSSKQKTAHSVSPATEKLWQNERYNIKCTTLDYG